MYYYFIIINTRILGAGILKIIALFYNVETTYRASNFSIIFQWILTQYEYIWKLKILNLSNCFLFEYFSNFWYCSIFFFYNLLHIVSRRVEYSCYQHCDQIETFATIWLLSWMSRGIFW